MAPRVVTAQEPDPEADEQEDPLVWGATNIGRAIRRKTRAVYHLHQTHQIPTKVVGGRLVARRSKLLSIAG